MNLQTAAIVGAAWKAGNCCLIGQGPDAETVAINTPMVIGFSVDIPGGLILPPAANANRPDIRPVA